MQVEFVYDRESNDSFWDDGDIFNKYMENVLAEEVGAGLDVVNDPWFKHDTGGTLVGVDDVTEWVKKNLDLSMTPSIKIVDVYNDDEPSIYVSLSGPEDEIEEFKEWAPTIWEFKLNKNYANKLGNNTYEFIFTLPDYVSVNPESPDLGQFHEAKAVSKKRMTEAVRLRAASELLQLVSRFVQTLVFLEIRGETDEEKLKNRIEDAAELMIETAKWVGFPADALKFLPWLVDGSCLCLGPIKLDELTNEIERQLKD